MRRVAAENGELLRTNKSAVAHWVAGSRPAGRTAAYIVEALSRRGGRPLTPDAIGLAGSGHTAEEDDPVSEGIVLGRADLDRLEFLRTAAFTTAGVAMPLDYDHDAVSRMLRARGTLGSVGDEEVQVVRQVTAAFAAADERLGGGHGLSTVAAYLADTAAPLLRCRFPDDIVRRSAFGAAAELAYLAGWKHHDLGREGIAQRYYLVGYRLACESDPHSHAAWMMRALAHQALSLGQPQHCIELIGRAIMRSRQRLDGQTEALLHVTHARAHARMRQRGDAARALLAAENALTRPAEPQPTFSAVAGPAAGTVASHTARALTDLGDHLGTERQHRSALRKWDREKFRRVHVLTHADLGDSLAAQARYDEAVGAWTRSLDLTSGVDSGRAQTAMRSVVPALLTYRRRGVPGAVDLYERLARYDIDRTMRT
ncbi:MAG: hypothetical protein LH603_06745 [Pseudonocardia sp.]|nr:hypothetical protein [Pseudonocardia sp.]